MNKRILLICDVQEEYDKICLEHTEGFYDCITEYGNEVLLELVKSLQADFSVDKFVAVINELEQYYDQLIWLYNPADGFFTSVISSTQYYRGSLLDSGLTEQAYKKSIILAKNCAYVFQYFKYSNNTYHEQRDKDGIDTILKENPNAIGELKKYHQRETICQLIGVDDTLHLVGGVWEYCLRELALVLSIENFHPIFLKPLIYN